MPSQGDIRPHETSTTRIGRDIDTLSGPRYTASAKAIQRYAYLPAYRNAIAYFHAAFEALGFSVSQDPIGNFVARNRPAGDPVFGLGSHCDSNRNGGKYDGTLGVATALEICRLNKERAWELPLQVISFLEEEGSAFGELLLGSRIVAQGISGEHLASIRALDDGRTFFEHATTAGFSPERWPECSAILDDLTGWMEIHIEQGRVLQDNNKRLGIVTAIAGYSQIDVSFTGREDHAGATPMNMRIDAGVLAGSVITELERLVRQASGGTVGTVGSVLLRPGLRNVIPGQAELTLDIRGVDDESFRHVARAITTFARDEAAARGAQVLITDRQSAPPTPMDERLVAALTSEAEALELPFMKLHSGAIHDTVHVAERVPSCMVFVPCVDGISHSPLESANVADAALAAELALNVIAKLT